MMIDQIYQQQDEEGEGEQSDGVMIGQRIVDGLYFIVDGDGSYAGLAGDTAADHHDYAEFADGVGEAKHSAGDQRGPDIGEQDADQGGAVGFAEGAGGGPKVGREAAEAGDDGARHKRQGIEQRSDYEAGEGEDQPDIQVVIEEAAERVGGAEGQEQVEAEDGRGQDHRKADEGFDGDLPTLPAIRQPVAEGDGDNRRGAAW